MIWDNYKIEWYIDGVLRRIMTKYYTLTGQAVTCPSMSANVLYIVNKAFPQYEYLNIIANLAIKSGTNNEPDTDTPFPSSLDIDYIRFYERQNCTGNMVITNNSQLNLNVENYNVIEGTSINLSGDILLQSGQQLALIENTEIVIGPNFTADAGSDFLAMTSPTVCNLSKSIKIEEDANEFSQDVSTKNKMSQNTDDKFNSNSEILIYPNSTRDNLYIEFLSNEICNYNIIITDLQGKVLYDTKKTDSKKMVLDLSHYNTGFYFLKIINENTNKMYFDKILKE